MAFNSQENINCWVAGADSASGLDFTPVACAPNGKLLSIDWAIPCSQNGVSPSGFNYQKATNGTKPRADAVKVLTIQDNAAGGNYGRWIVTDAYTIADYIEACCAGCDPLPAVTIPAPILFNGEPTYAPATSPAVVYKGTINVPVLAGGMTTHTATGYAYDANGVAIVISPATSAGTTVALLAADMQTNWAAELGVATFAAVGQEINWTATIAATIGVTIVQS